MIPRDPPPGEKPDYHFQERWNDPVLVRAQQFRLMLFDRPLGEWRDYREQVQRDMLRRRLAHREDDGSNFCEDGPAWIAVREIGWVERPFRDLNWETSTSRASSTSPGGSSTSPSIA